MYTDQSIYVLTGPEVLGAAVDGHAGHPLPLKGAGDVHYVALTSCFHFSKELAGKHLLGKSFQTPTTLELYLFKAAWLSLIKLLVIKNTDFVFLDNYLNYTDSQSRLNLKKNSN